MVVFAQVIASLVIGVVAGVGGGAPGSFLSMEEAGLGEIASIDMHDFIVEFVESDSRARRYVAIEELNAGRMCDWFQKDKVKRETDVETATLKWESNDW